jgi:hypothetical protein
MVPLAEPLSDELTAAMTGFPQLSLCNAVDSVCVCFLKLLKFRGFFLFWLLCNQNYRVHNLGAGGCTCYYVRSTAGFLCGIGGLVVLRHHWF